ncbi:hypothetical protein ZWY2020_012458 [Hordeum vulgare]|nr:hypothetical protein ZWY2020_012458 [Hordeum vulgare]
MPSSEPHSPLPPPHLAPSLPQSPVPTIAAAMPLPLSRFPVFSCCSCYGSRGDASGVGCSGPRYCAALDRLRELHQRAPACRRAGGRARGSSRASSLPPFSFEFRSSPDVQEWPSVVILAQPAALVVFARHLPHVPPAPPVTWEAAAVSLSPSILSPHPLSSSCRPQSPSAPASPPRPSSPRSQSLPPPPRCRRPSRFPVSPAAPLWIACDASGVGCTQAHRRFAQLDRLRSSTSKRRQPAAEQVDAARQGSSRASSPSHSANFEFRVVSTALYISWAKTGGAQLSSVPYPGSLPRVPAGGILIQRPVDWSYYQNAVTSSFLPAFSGNIPAALKLKFPSAKVTHLGNWCMLHNFAADFEMYGVLDAVASGPIDARLSENSTMVGVGMSMEGIEQNPIVYDLMSEMVFHHRQVDLKVWVETYPTRRSRKSVVGLQDAWRILHQTLYNCTDGKNDKNRDVIVAFPDVEPSVIQTPGLYARTSKNYSTTLSENYVMKDAPNDAYEQPHIWYDTIAVIHALELFLESGDEVSDSSTFRYDLVDLTPNKYWSGLLRDYYGPRAAIYFKHLISSLKKKEPFALEEWRREWISLTNNWQSDRKVFATTATGDALNISRPFSPEYLRNADSLGLDGMDSFVKPISL